MDIAGKARKLERRISRTVDAAVEEFVGTSAITPLEIVHAAVDRAEQQIQEIGRGRRVFPFNLVRVRVVAGPKEKEARARIAAVVDGPPTLAERIVARLRSAGCAVKEIATDVVFERGRGAGWPSSDFHVEFDQVALPAAAPAAVEPISGADAPIRLTVLTGKAAQRVYVFKKNRIDIGRRAEVFDQRQRLVRTNHVAFLDEGADQNATVSRRHAHIDFDAAQGGYRLWDDRSAHGTSIIRNGRTIRVPAGARGMRLEPGDEIVLGAARLKVSFGDREKRV
jgi:pSer/pThr/pTyr-binding forkhead associated (FHA) protein